MHGELPTNPSSFVLCEYCLKGSSVKLIVKTKPLGKQMTLKLGIVLLLIVFEAVSAALYVNPSAGADTAGCGTLAQPCLSISGALARFPESIYLLPGTYSGSANVALHITIPVEFVAQGSGVVIDGGNAASSSWSVTAAISVQGVLFQRMTGAINVVNQVSTFVSCDFRNNLGTTFTRCVHLTENSKPVWKCSPALWITRKCIIHWMQLHFKPPYG